MNLSEIMSNYGPDKNFKTVKSNEEFTVNKPDGKSIFAEFKENGNGVVDVTGDVECSEGATLSNNILKFLKDNAGKSWYANNNELLNAFKELLSAFNAEASVNNEEPDDPPNKSDEPDTRKPGAKWTVKEKVSGSGYYSETTIRYERLEDMTIRKTEVGHSGATGAVVLNSLYQEDGETLISRDYITTLGNSGVVATANYDESGIKISDTYNLDSIKMTSSSKAWILSSAILNSKDGTFELQDKDGNVIMTVDGDKILNGKGKPVRKDLYDFLEKYNNTEGLKLIKRY